MFRGIPDNPKLRAAACKGMDTDIFFRGGRSNEAAKRICSACTVREACEEDALSHEDPKYRWGVWGGKTGSERGG